MASAHILDTTMILVACCWLGVIESCSESGQWSEAVSVLALFKHSRITVFHVPKMACAVGVHLLN